MSRAKKGRESAAPRGSQYIDGQLIHTATNQKLFFQTHICTVFRETLKPAEDFSRIAAIRTMDKNLKKRQAHGTGNILQDRFTLEKNKGGKEPFRPYVYYREIVDVIRSKVKPEYFVLSVDSEKSGSKYYEVYKCKTREDAHKMENYFKRAMEDPQKMINNGPVLDVVPVIENPDMRRSLIHVDFQTSLESLDDNGRTSTIYQLTSPTPPEGVEYTPPQPQTRRYSPVPSPVVQRQQLVARTAPAPSPPRQSTPSPPPTRRRSSMDGLDDVTYISFDPKTRRPMVSDLGPVYMYSLSHNKMYGRSSPSRGRTGSPIYNSSLYNGGNSSYYRY